MAWCLDPPGLLLTATKAPSRTDLSAALEPFAAAAMRGHYELLLAEAERAVVRLYPAARAQVIVRTGGAWHEWSSVDHDGGAHAIDAPAAFDAADSVVRRGAVALVPVVRGALGIRVDGDAPGIESSGDVDVLRRFFALALQTCERQRIATQNLDEVQALQRVATRMLESHELGEILLLITQEAKRLLSADICGVMLLEGDGLVMKRCVGNRSPETASLAMRPGQGLAGLVLAHGKPAAVEDYVTSDAISRDFFHLAEAELVRSALAAPLTARGAVTGVLEVWRRRPSTFTPQDTMRLVALANLTSIAIENAKLYASQARVVEELGRANAALEQRYDMVRSVSSLTQSLMQMLLQGAGFGAMTAAAAAFLRTDLGVIDEDATPVAWSGEGDAATALAPVAHAAKLHARRGGSRRKHSEGEASTATVQGVRWRVQPIVVEGDTVGWALGRIDDGRDALVEVTLVQVAMFAALRRLEQRAASRARAETIDAIVWDLLRADDAAARAAAIDRAADLEVDLGGALRVVLCELGPATPGSAERAGSALRQLLARAIAAVRADGVRALALQGPLLALIAADQELDQVERFAQRLALSASEALDGRLVVAGSSSHCVAARELGTAYREAQIALDVARQVGRSGAVVYDRAGVVGMLLGLRHEAGMQRFLELNLGALLEEDEKQRAMLLHTLRVYFDVNCSHEAASQRLGVHRKTIAHRLAKIGELTGLDLSTHDDRLVADLSLYVYRMLAGREA